MPVQHDRLSRQELYDLVWSEAVSKVAARYNLSDVGLKKICLKHRIPVPPRGYWQKVAAGKKVQKIALPAVTDADEIVIRVVSPAITEAVAEGEFDAAIEAEDNSPPVIVSEALHRPHGATIALREALRRDPDSQGAVHSFVPEAFGCRVSKSSVSRVLRIADALAKACEARGFTLLHGKKGERIGGQLRVVVDGFSYDISFSERMRQEAYRLTPAELERRKQGQYVYAPAYQYTPTGELTIKIYPMYGSGLRGVWNDTKRRQVEACLGDVMLSLRRVAAWQAAERAKAEARQVRYEAEQQRRAVLRAEIETERVRVEQLGKDAAAWRRAQDIRVFVDARAAQMAICASHPDRASADGLANDPEAKRWLQWASDQADRLDPLRTSPPSIIDTPEHEISPVSIWSFDR